MRTFILSLSAVLLLSACTRADNQSISDQLPVALSITSSVSSEFSLTQNSSFSSISSTSSSPSISSSWNPDLTPEQLAILRDAGTERPFTSPLLNEHRKGTFVTADCNIPVFRSEQKFDSGTGWPSFWAPISPDAMIEKTDTTFGMTRTEILSKCGGHLGHVFTDGPKPTGLRCCMNGLALKFIPDPIQ